jgi:hypothetical protein
MRGFVWLLPRFAPAPWVKFVPQAWQVTDAADLQWVLPRLRPTSFGHFTEPVKLQLPDAEQPRRVYIRCRHWPNPGFDRSAGTAQASPAWDYAELATSHLSYITSPDQLSDILLEIAG